MKKQLAGLTTAFLGRHYLFFDEMPSTSVYLKENAASLPHGTVVRANYQTQGRGRLGRDWNDRPGLGLAHSVLLEGQRLTQLPLLPLIVGIGVARGLERLCGEAFRLKWSNDVLHNNKKICGILCESRIADGQTEAPAILGIGVNVLQTEEDFRRLGLVYATSLRMATNQSWDIETVAVSVLNELEPVLTLFEEKGFHPLLPEYRRRCVTLNKPVQVQVDGEARTGYAVDIAEDGSLVCEIGGAIYAVSAGETSVRGLYGYV